MESAWLCPEAPRGKLYKTEYACRGVEGPGLWGKGTEVPSPEVLPAKWHKLEDPSLHPGEFHAQPVAIAPGIDVLYTCATLHLT